MPAYVVTKVTDALNLHERSVKGAAVLVLGVSYKPNIADIRESPSLDIIEMLQEKGANVAYNDPFVDEIDINNLQMKSVEINDHRLTTSDCIIIATNHSTYDYARLVQQARCIVDTRNATKNVLDPEGKVLKL